MRERILCSETRRRLVTVLQRRGGAETLRELARRFRLYRWQVEQAAELGWVEIFVRKPSTGRPATVARLVSETWPAKGCPFRQQLEQMITHKHQLFAIYAFLGGVKGGVKRYPGLFINGKAPDSLSKILNYTEAYQRVYPNARCRAGAAASMSRLLRHPSVKALRAWGFAKLNGEISTSEPTPSTPSAIWRRLREVKSYWAR